MVQKGDWITVGDLYARSRIYDPIVGRQAKVLHVSDRNMEIQIYNSNGDPTSTWYIQHADARPLSTNSSALILLNHEL